MKAANPTSVVSVLDLNWCLLALKEVNRRVAASFGIFPVEVTFKFVGHIATTKTTYTRGTADHQTKTVTLLAARNWQEAAVHELVHIYQPHLSEQKVRRVTPQVIQYLLAFKE